MPAVKVRDVSATAFAYLECGARYLAEHGLGIKRDTRKLDRGKAFHVVMENLNRLMMQGLELSEDECKKIVMATNQDPTTSADMLEAAIWWGARMAGVKPIGVEDDGGRWQLKMGDLPVVGKFDMVYVNAEKEGRMTIVDYKSGFVPDKEAAKNTIQNKLYAWAAMEVFGVTQVDVMMVSLMNRFMFTLEYDAVDVERVRPFIERDAAKVYAANESIAKMKDGGGVDEEIFKPRLNAFCDSCPKKRECPDYVALVYGIDPPSLKFASRPEAVQRLNERAKLIDQEKERVKGDLKADAAAGDVYEGGYTVRLKTVTKNMKAMPAREQIETRLVIEKEDGGA